jgi:chemotaxis protein CheY-P-specific phosphatase CheC
MNKSGNGNSKDIRLIEQMIESVIRKRDHHYDKAKNLSTKSQIQEHKFNAEFCMTIYDNTVFLFC